MSEILSAVSYALVGTAVGVAGGAVLSLAHPPLKADETLTETLTLTAIQTISNGVLIYYASRLLRSGDDPTGGVPFMWALVSQQPAWRDRLMKVGEAARKTLPIHLVAEAVHSQKP